jgi:hypothetical protein
MKFSSLRIRLLLVVALLSTVAVGSNAQSAVHTKFFTACDSINRYVVQQFNSYEPTTQQKMCKALHKACAASYAQALADDHLLIPYAVLPNLPSAELEAHLAARYNIHASTFDVAAISNPLYAMFDSAMYHLILLRYGATVFAEPATPNRAATKTTSKPSNASLPTKSKTPASEASLVASEILMPGMNRISEIAPYLKRKFALDDTQILTGDFALLNFNERGKLVKIQLISVDAPADNGGAKQSAYLKKISPAFSALALKLGWIGPKLNGKYYPCTIALSLHDYSMRLL